MILITGANGHFGQTVINFLLDWGTPASDITGLVRSEDKGAPLKQKGVGIRIGDYNNYDSLVSAFRGVDKILLISGSDLNGRSQQHENVVKAAKNAGVSYIAYTSYERKNESDDAPLAVVGESHLYTEKLIRESGLSYTLLRNNLYLDFIPMFLGEKVLKTGIYVPAGNGKAAVALRGEMAEVAARVMSGKGHENKEYRISNSEAVSFGEMADMLSEISGKKVSYTSPDRETFVKTMVDAGVPREYVETTAAFAIATQEGDLNPAKSDLEMLLGRKPTSVKSFLEQVYG